MTDEYGPTAKFTAPARLVARQLARILPFADTSDWHRLGVQLERRGDHLLASTTDRFTVATVRITITDWPDGVPTDWSITLPTALVKRLIAQWRTYPSATALTLSSTADEGAGHEVELRDDAGATIGDRFPALTMPTNLLDFYLAADEAADTPPGDLVAFNADYLLRFAKARTSPSDQLAIRFPAHEGGKTKPTTVVVGSDFIGCIMPQRLSANAPTVESLLPPKDATSS